MYKANVNPQQYQPIEYQFEDWIGKGTKAHLNEESNPHNESHHAETCLFSAMHNCMWQNTMFSHIADINAQMGPMGPMEDGWYFEWKLVGQSIH